MGGMLHLSGILSAEAGGPAVQFDPVAEGMDWGSEEPSGSPEYSPRYPVIRFSTRPEDVRWAPKGRTLRLSEDISPYRKFKWDPETGKFEMRVIWHSSGIREVDPFVLHVDVGEDSGSTTLDWEQRGHRGLRLR